MLRPYALRAASCRGQCLIERSELEWLGDARPACAVEEPAHLLVHEVARREDHAFGVGGVVAAQPLDQLLAGEVRHAHIADHGIVFDALRRTRASSPLAVVSTSWPLPARYRCSDTRTDASSSTTSTRSRSLPMDCTWGTAVCSPEERGVVIGSSTTNRAPVCGFSAQIRPSCSRTIPSEIESPRPVPEPVGLVVKKGLKIRSIRFAGIPSPVSSTSIRIASALRRLPTVRRGWCPSHLS